MITHFVKICSVAVVLSSLIGCAAGTKDYAISPEQAKANRDYSAKLQQEDRDRDHIERMRRAEAIKHATSNVKGGVTYSPTTVVVPR